MKIIILIIIAFSAYSYLDNDPVAIESHAGQTTSDDSAITNAFHNRKSNVQVKGSGIVVRVLTDDLDGSKHQKFILKLSSGQTLLMSHNIDLAPRINSLHKGDTVIFYGEYEWNSKGGVVHWTHHDPSGKHVGGWLKHNGATYQ